MAKSTAQHLASLQSEWVGPRKLERAGYVFDLADNLYLGRLHAETDREFRDADGSELESVRERPAKMKALCSSSALAVNVFDYWRDKPAAPLSQALAIGPIAALRFEYKCANHPVGPRTPNIDVLLTLRDGTRLAIESKFCEPYGAKGAKALSPKYFNKIEGFWEAKGATRTQKLAESLRSPWVHLDVPQLLKHLLGLSYESQPTGYTLLYLWFDARTQEARLHEREIQEFAAAIDGDPVAFRSMTYQDLFRKLSGALGGDDAEYGRYLQQRYFREVA
jgi:hypothetical protein